MKGKVVFLDRDGTINERPHDHQYVLSEQDLIWLPGAIEGITRIYSLGFKIFIVSNQRCISLGLITMDELDVINFKLIKQLRQNNVDIEKILVCPHDYSDNCNCRKPKIGLFLEAETFFEVDKGNSFMVGDSESDIIAGNSYGVKTVFIGDCNVKISDFCFNSLFEFSEFLNKKYIHER